MTTTYGFKAMNPNMTCRNFQFELGKTYQIDNEMPLKLCSESGFHFCLNFEDVFDYYNWHASRVFKIKSETEVLTRSNKSITKEITILEEVALEKMNLKQLKTKDSKLFMINNFRDEKLIFNTFKSDEDEDVRKAVVNKLSDENLIYSFKDDEDWKVRKAVVNKLSDENLIFDTFKDDEFLSIREAVVEKLSDEKLISYFKNDEDWYISEAVIGKLEAPRNPY